MCNFKDCGRPAKSRGLCQGHYAQQYKGKPLTPIREWDKGGSTGACLFPGCNIERRARGYCFGHYRNLYGITQKPYEPHINYPTCTFDGCDRAHKGKGLCSAHYRQQLKGQPLRPIRARLREPGIRSDGYKMIYVPSHPNSQKSGMVLEHVVVMSDMIGRPLVRGENVHHKNGQKADNRPSNLELWNTSQPGGQRPEDKVAYAMEILALYAPDRLAP